MLGIFVHKLRLFPCLASGLLLACAGAPHGGAGTGPIQRTTANMVLGFIKHGECRNWNEALDIARAAACCGRGGAGPNRGDKSCTCQKAVPCDVCLFINGELRPDVHFASLHKDPWGRKILGETSFPEGIDQPGKIRFERALCHDPFATTKLARTMIHEAVHYCTTIDFDQKHLEEDEAEAAESQCLP